jgi:hypothetical protein
MSQNFDFQDFRDPLQESSPPIATESCSETTLRQTKTFAQCRSSHRPLAEFLSTIYTEEEMEGFGEMMPNENLLEFGPDVNNGIPITVNQSEDSMALKISPHPLFCSFSAAELPVLPAGVEDSDVEGDVCIHSPATRFLLRETSIRDNTMDYPEHQDFDIISATYRTMCRVEEERRMTREKKSEMEDEEDPKILWSANDFALRIIAAAGVGLHFGDPDFGHSRESTYGTLSRIFRHVDQFPIRFPPLHVTRLDPQNEVPTVTFITMMTASNLPIRYLMLNFDYRWISDSREKKLKRFWTVVNSLLSPLTLCESWAKEYAGFDYKTATPLAMEVIAALIRLEKVIDNYRDINEQQCNETAERIRDEVSEWMIWMDTEQIMRDHMPIQSDPQNPTSHLEVVCFSTLVLRVLLLYIIPYAVESMGQENRQLVHWMNECFDDGRDLRLKDFLRHHRHQNQVDSVESDLEM